MAREILAIGDSGSQLVNKFNNNSLECYSSISTLQQSGGVGLNVKSFGVIGDGITDDIVALQAITDSAATDRLALYVPDGTYVISSTWYIPSYTTIRFSANAIIKTNNNINLIEFIGSYIFFDYGIFDVRSVVNYTKSAFYFGLSNNAFITIERPTFMGTVVADYDVNSQSDFTTKEPIGGKAIYFYKPAATSFYATVVTINNIYIYGYGVGLEMYCIPFVPGPFPWITACKFQGTIWEASRAINIAEGYINGHIFEFITETGTNSTYHCVLGGSYNNYILNTYDVPDNVFLVRKGSVYNNVTIYGGGFQAFTDLGNFTNISNGNNRHFYPSEYQYLTKSGFFGINSRWDVSLTENAYAVIVEEARRCHRFTTSGTENTWGMNITGDRISGEARKVIISMYIKCAHANNVSYTIGLDPITKYPRQYPIESSGKYRILLIVGNDITVDNIDGLVNGDYLWVFGEAQKNYVSNPVDYPITNSVSLADNPRRLEIQNIDAINNILTIINTDSVSLAVGQIMSKFLELKYMFYRSQTGIFNSFTLQTFTFEFNNYNIRSTLGYRLQLTISSANSDVKQIFIDEDIHVQIFDELPQLYDPPVYADNAAALAGGLVAGENYRTATGQLMIVY